MYVYESIKGTIYTVFLEPFETYRDKVGTILRFKESKK